MKRLLLAILFFAVTLGGLRAQVYLPINGSVDDSTKNRKIFISFHSTTCTVYDTALTWSWTSGFAYFGKAFTIPAGCGYGIFKFKMVNCFGDTIERLDYFDSTRSSNDTLRHSFKYCDSCDLVSANFSATKGSLTVNFGNYSNKANNYTWLFGDSTTSNATSPTKVYASPGYYNVCLIARDTLTGCADTFCKAIQVGPVCHFFSAFFYHSSIVNKSVYFYGYSSSIAHKYKWDFGDATTSTDQYPPQHTYSTGGIKNVCFMAYDTINNCADTQCYNVNIPDPCTGFHAGFKDTVNHISKTVSFADTSGPNSNKYTWYFGDATTSSSKNPSHTYAAYGTYNVCQVVRDTVKGCKDSICRNVVITNPCTGFSAGFTDSDSGRKVTFTNTSSANANKFNWTFGNSSTSTAKNPIYTYAANGTYNVCLVARDTVAGCKDSVCHNVTVFSC
ncbi:MAG TPA: PKD domain-containing protein, partial [Bacteroidia bacterium]|nr:PKD domain-containing protein [Bacteroidia bacterium]